MDIQHKPIIHNGHNQFIGGRLGNQIWWISLASGIIYPTLESLFEQTLSHTPKDINLGQYHVMKYSTGVVDDLQKGGAYIAYTNPSIFGFHNTIPYLLNLQSGLWTEETSMTRATSIHVKLQMFNLQRIQPPKPGL